MPKKLLLTVAVVSVLGINPPAHALSWEDAKSLFDAPVTSTTQDQAPNEPAPGTPAPGTPAPGDPLPEQPAPVADSELPGESEPNNSASSADPINSGVEFTGQLFSGADQDWFRFETTQNNAIITIQTSVANSAWTLTLVDRAGNTIASANNSKSVGDRLGTDDPAFRLAATAEKAGTYYLIVRPAPETVADDGSPIFQTFVDEPYRITVTISDPTNPDNPVIDSNFNDLETEPNNGYGSDGVFRTDPLASGKILLGQLLTGGDEDWFEIQSPGNEIIDIDFCGPGSPCEGQTSRIVMVLKKEFMDANVLDALSSPALVNVNVEGKRVPAGTIPPYIEYLGSQGLLGDALIGKIHPDFGQSNHLQIGIDEPGTYYFVVAGKLQRDSNGAIDTHVKTETKQIECDANGDGVVDFSPCQPEVTVVTEGPFVVFEDFNDDQYSIRIRRTNLAPHTPGTPAFAAERERAKFDSATGIIHIPALEFNGAVFEAELIHREDAELNLYELLQIREIVQ